MAQTAFGGFVLAGGQSRRMGRDKGLLEWHGVPLASHVARAVADAAGSVTLIGRPETYGHLGYPVVPDDNPGLGPLGGIATALRHSDALWNLVVACDMPAVTAGFLSSLYATACASDCDCLLPQRPAGILEPLCAAYHRDSLPAIREALARGVRKVTAGLTGLRIHTWPVDDEHWFANVNTPDDWLAVSRR